MDRHNNVDENIVITIPCVELEEAPIVECPCAPSDGCYWFRSKHPIPKFKDGVPLAVSTVDGNITFNYLRWFNFPRRLKSRNKAQRVQPYYTFKNQDNKFHLYVYANAEVCGEKLDQLQSVMLAGEFEFPLEVSSFPVCGDFNPNSCNPLDQEFYIEPEHITSVFQLAYESIGAAKSVQANSDIFNNDNEDSEAPQNLNQ